jgi:hypothetical protein
MVSGISDNAERGKEDTSDNFNLMKQTVGLNKTKTIQ